MGTRERAARKAAFAAAKAAKKAAEPVPNHWLPGSVPVTRAWSRVRYDRHPKLREGFVEVVGEMVVGGFFLAAFSLVAFAVSRATDSEAGLDAVAGAVIALGGLSIFGVAGAAVFWVGRNPRNPGTFIGRDGVLISEGGKGLIHPWSSIAGFEVEEPLHGVIMLIGVDASAPHARIALPHVRRDESRWERSGRALVDRLEELRIAALDRD